MKMSPGLTPSEFVQQVYYNQEKVILDFWPTDDKYREVLVEANMVLQELQASEDWTWLREHIVLGSCHSEGEAIPEFELPDSIYKVSTLNHDSLKLFPLHYRFAHCHIPRHKIHHDMIDRNVWIEVPIASAGDNGFKKRMSYGDRGFTNTPDLRLRAIVIGNVITFNRPLNWFERGCVAELDVQRRIELFHVCDDTCTLDDDHTCPKAKERYLEEIPDPNYVVVATAARHAVGSPPAQGNIQPLTDQAQRILSAMRQNDAAATDADYLEREPMGFIEVV